MAHITIARSAREMEELASLWNRLVSSGSYSMFQSYAWNRFAAEKFADRLDPLVTAVETSDGAAIVPAAIHRAAGHIELLGETLFDYRDVLHAGNPEVLRVAWQQLAQFEKKLLVTAIEGEAAHRHWQQFPLLPFARSPEVRKNLTSERQFRLDHKRLGRLLRRIQAQGARLRVFTGEDSALVRYLYSSKCEQFPEDATNIFRDAARRQFMIDVAAMEGKRCEIFTLQTEDEILVAGLLTFRDAGWRRFYTIYFDPAWAAFSPGILLVHEATARSLAEGLDCDYMTGEYPYKLRFGNSARELYKIDLSAGQLAEIAKKAAVFNAA